MRRRYKEGGKCIKFLSNGSGWTKKDNEGIRGKCTHQPHGSK
jgi:hypothetical protein